MANLPTNPVYKEWLKGCDACQEPLDTRADGEWWAQMEEVFHCDQSELEDVGTTGPKAIAFGLDGRIIAQAYRVQALIQLKWEMSDKQKKKYI